MPNRILKESICRSEEIDQLSWFEEVLFYRLIVNCDDYGRFDGRASIIKSLCFPLKNMRGNDIEKALAKLSAAGLVKRYEVDGKPVLQLMTWERHQTIRAKRAKYPSDPNTSDKDDRLSADVYKRNHLPKDESNYKHMHTSACNCKQMYAYVPVIQSESEVESEREEPPISPLAGGSESAPVDPAHVDEATANATRTMKRLENIVSELFEGTPPELLEAARRWVRYKQQCHQPPVKESMISFLSELKQNGEKYGTTAAIDEINHAIAGGWSNVAWDRLEKQKTWKGGSGGPTIAAWDNA
jgi:hypothetical protein